MFGNYVHSKMEEQFECELLKRRFYRVLTMVYNTQNYWGFGLYPSSGF
jgi:microsomal dipeptidase-like Zn-dependent dipeptidase